MRVAMYYNNNDIRIEEVQKPEIEPGEILLKVKASGICGSDVMEWYRIKKAPLVLGHEIAGQVVQVGENVKGIKVMDRIFVSHHVPCEECYHCKSGNHTVCDQLRSTNFIPGGFSEYLRIPEINLRNGVFMIPDNVSYAVGTFIEPLACVVRGQRKAGIKEGQSVLVIGSGISGLLHIKLAKARGVERIFATDMNQKRLDIAKKFGAVSVFKASDNVPERLQNWNKGQKADVVIVCAGALSAIEQALMSVERGGTVLVFAPTKPDVKVSVDMWELWLNCQTITTTYAASPEDIKEAIQLLGDNVIKVDDMITHRLPLAETGKGFKMVEEARDSIKVIIEPGK